MRYSTVLSVWYVACLASASSGLWDDWIGIRGLESQDGSISEIGRLFPRSPSGLPPVPRRKYEHKRIMSGGPSGGTNRPSSTVTGNTNAGRTEDRGGSSRPQTAPSQPGTAPSNPNRGESRRPNPGDRAGARSPPPTASDRERSLRPDSGLSLRYRQDMSRGSAGPAIRIFAPPRGIPGPPPYAVHDADTPFGYGYKEYPYPPPAMVDSSLGPVSAWRQPGSTLRIWPKARVETVATGPGKFHADGGAIHKEENLAPHWVGSKVADNPVRVAGGGETGGYGKITTRVSGRKASANIDTGPGGSAKVRYGVPGGTAEATFIHPARGKLGIASQGDVPVVMEAQSLGNVDIRLAASNSPPRDGGPW